MEKGHVYLIPTIIAENENDVIPEQVRQVIKNTRYYLVENLRSARRYISGLQLGLEIDRLNFEVLDKNTPPEDLRKLMNPIFAGQNIGVISESGCPGIADPGSSAVKFAHSHQIRVVPLVGPSSIFLALMASGFNGQRFAFHGYLPIDKKELEKSVKNLEHDSRKNGLTQIFIEAPYRNNQMLAHLIKHCQPETKLCVARDVSGKQEFIKMATIKAWKSIKVELHKIPTVFLIYAGS